MALWALVLLVTGARSGPQVEDNYPIGGLKCLYTLKKGINVGIAGGYELGAIICPEGQNNYCMKQVRRTAKTHIRRNIT